ncbi:MAG: hypothetical protein CMJ58_12560 [Planctomycetaceae bacterium]|nr:hypothetical protein [Planctomycetaceae bacterium]
MANRTPRKQPERLSITVTFSEEDRADFELLAERAEQAGQKRSSFARELLLAALHFDQRQHELTALAGLEEKLEKLNRNVARGAFLGLRAAEMRADGQQPPEAKQWVHEVMVLKDL